MSAILSILAGPFGPPLASIAIAIIGAILGKGQDNANARQHFLDMVQSMEAAGSVPSGLHAKYAAQLQTASDAAAAEYEKEQKNAKV